MATASGFVIVDDQGNFHVYREDLNDVAVSTIYNYAY